MAEYVRRKRPPATHPYWARLHDRAHPPQLVTPIAVPTFIGLALGLCGGLQPPFSATEAARLSATVATVVAAAVFVLALAILWVDQAGQLPRRVRGTMAVLTGVCWSLFAFCAFFFLMFVVLCWFVLCSGHGPWFGMTIGAATAGAPGVLYAVATRWRWQARQRRWPRWERMRARRTTAALSVTQIPLPPAAEPAPEPRGQVGTGA
jgi:hypothetical protein